MQTFVALLRGVNVGGHNRVPMAELRTGLARRGMHQVRTYIASGNIVLGAPEGADASGIADVVQSAITEDFAVTCSVLVRTAEEIRRIAATIPDHWSNAGDQRTDVLYLFPDVDQPDVLDRLPAVDGVDEARYTPGAVLWRMHRPLYSRSGLPRIIGTPLYARVTVRNVNTARTLAAMVTPEHPS